MYLVPQRKNLVSQRKIKQLKKKNNDGKFLYTCYLKFYFGTLYAPSQLNTKGLPY